MRPLFSPSILLCLLSLSVIPTYAASVGVNGVCESGTCNAQDVISLNSLTSSPFDFVYTFANSDRYQATGTVGALATSSELSITAANITLTYLGNSTGTASADDVFSIDFLQYFRDGFSAGSNDSGYEYISGNFSGAYSDASSVSGQGRSNGTSMQLLGPFSPPSDFAASLSGQPFSFSSTTRFEFLDTVTFGPGSDAGATISVANVPENPPPTSPVPEPSTWIGVGTGMLALLRRARLTKAFA